MRAFLPLLALLAASAAAQTQQVLFPGQTGAGLRASIRAAYRPTAVTGDNDDLYSVIERVTVDGQDGVVCVYTGWFVPFDCAPSCDPSQDMFNDGAGINQEHTWPQSLLTGVAVDDFHNIFPSQVGVNADRGNLPFAEIQDDQTSRWYRGGPPYTQTTPPPLSERDAYSELRTGTSFEPREAHEGNVARALFYVYTVYDPQTNGTFPFDAAQQRQLYAWHDLDPVDQAEYDRTFRVAPFQQDKPNPFVLDSTLIRRAYPELTTTAVEPPPPQAALTAAPNPFRDGAVLRLTLPAPAPARVEVLDALGRRVALLHDGPLSGGTEAALRLDGRALPPGLYVARVTAGAFTAVRPLIRAP
jgi:hypothetical protein